MRFVLVIPLLTGCTIIGAGVGSAGGTERTTRAVLHEEEMSCRHERGVLEQEALAIPEREQREVALSELPPCKRAGELVVSERTVGGNVAAGAFVGLLIDVALVVAFVTHPPHLQR